MSSSAVYWASTWSSPVHGLKGSSRSRVSLLGCSCRSQRKILCASTAPPLNLGDGNASYESNGSNVTENLARSTNLKDEANILIECRDVYKSFEEKQILNGISFKIRQGEAVGIIGPSGTGKSTVLKIMAGLLAPDKGEVLICGKIRHGLIDDEEITGLRIGLVFQSAALFDWLNVRENVGFVLYEHSKMPHDKIAERVKETLAAVGLKILFLEHTTTFALHYPSLRPRILRWSEKVSFSMKEMGTVAKLLDEQDVEHKMPSELSGGMKKRVALARAIIYDNTKEEIVPEVLLYDEPTAGLDPIASTVIEDLIRSVHLKGESRAGKLGKIASYVVVTHQHSTIKRAVDRLLFLHEGKIVWEGMTHEFTTSTNPVVEQFALGCLDGPIKY